MNKEYKINSHNSTVCGYPGRDFDWSKFDWDGKTYLVSGIANILGITTERQAPLPYTDNFFIGENAEYLHVPYSWSGQGTIYRVRPNDSMYPGKIYRGYLIKSQKAIKKEDGWYWVLEF